MKTNGEKEFNNKVEDLPIVQPVVKEKSISELADEVEQGIHGSGRERMIVLGDNYQQVQAEVLRRMRQR